MKPTITFVFFSLLSASLLLSCSKDDSNTDEVVNPPVKEDYFPRKIVATYPTNPGNNHTINFTYGMGNRINGWEDDYPTATYTFQLTYTGDNISRINLVIVRPPNEPVTFKLDFSYSNNIATKVDITNPLGAVSSQLFTYNATTRTYTVTTSISTFEFQFDATGNLIRHTNSLGTKTISYSDSKGVFRNIQNSLPLAYTSLLEPPESYYFFSTKQISKVTNAGSTLNWVTITDMNYDVGKVSVTDPATGAVSLKLDITYEIRNL